MDYIATRGALARYYYVWCSLDSGDGCYLATSSDDLLRVLCIKGAALVVMIEINYFGGIILPISGFLALAWCLPTFLARFLPISIKGLIVNGIFSIGVMAALGPFYMWCVGGIDAGEGFVLSALWHSMRFALIWAPVLFLALIVQPQRWRPDL